MLLRPSGAEPYYGYLSVAEPRSIVFMFLRGVLSALHTVTSALKERKNPDRGTATGKPVGKGAPQRGITLQMQHYLRENR